MRTRLGLMRCLAAGAATLIVAACGAAHPPGSRPSYELQSRTIPGAGRVLTDGRGFTLYIFVPDHRERSRCSGLCARQWPPLTLPAGVHRPAAGRGVRGALLGTVRRTAGARQVTYNGWPLYLWRGDHAPGQATGQADDMGLWYMLSASGSVDRRPVSAHAGD